MSGGIDDMPMPSPLGYSAAVNRLRLGLSIVAASALLATAACASSSATTPTAGSPATNAPASVAPSTASATPTATTAGAACTWGPAGNPAAAKTGTPPPVAPNKGKATMTIVTNRGKIVIDTNRATTPCTVASFAFLAGKHFFDKTPCHRLTAASAGIAVLQCGDPTGTGTGGPAYTIPDESLPAGGASLPAVTYPRGTVAMANTGQPNSGGSQFFLVYKDSPLPPAYTKFGTITKGLDVLDKIAAAGETDSNGPGDGAPKQPVEIISFTVTGS
jgi:peptidyl-prolyl cis-trans isomerase B (cyclophilin B)